MFCFCLPISHEALKSIKYFKLLLKKDVCHVVKLHDRTNKGMRKIFFLSELLCHSLFI